MSLKSSRRSPKAVISGYYGFGNCGDEAVLLAIIHCLRTLHPDVRITVFSNKPSMTRELYGVKAVNRWNPVRIAFEIMTCRLMISGGGSLLQDVTSTRSLYYYLAMLRMAILLGKRVMIYSQGIGPLGGEKSRVRVSKILSRCHTITVRDTLSAELLRELAVKPDVQITCDPVMGFCREDIDITEAEALLRGSDIPDSTDEKRKPLLLAVIRSWKDDRHTKPVAEFLDTQVALGWDVLLVPAHFSADMEVIARLGNLMTAQTHCIEKRLTASQFLALSARADRVFSMRLHGLICAMAMGTPMIGLSYDPKVDGFMEYAGAARYCLPFDGLDPETATRLMAELDAMDPLFKQETESRRLEMRKLAWETAGCAAKLLDEKPGSATRGPRS